MKNYILTLTLILIPVYACPQHLGAYTDYRDRFFIFDRGKNIKAEDQPVQSFKIGGNCILYINSQGHLNMYKDGDIMKLEPGGITNYFATDHLAAYSVFEKLSVIEGTTPVVLSTWCPVYAVEDSLIVFYDKNQESLKVYYNEEIEDIESGLLGMPVKNLKSGDNIIAYISSRTNDFKIYYQGVNHTIISNIRRISFKAGKDIVAYVDPIDNSFQVFFKGETFRIEDFPPESYTTGDGFVAYVDNTGVFKIFYKGEITELSSFAPDGYIAEDNLVLFTEDRFFRIFYDGAVHEVEGFVPGNFEMDWNTVIYVDNTSRIWKFSKGEKRMLVNDLVESFNIYRDLVIMGLKMDRTLIYYNNQVYDGVSY